MSSPTRNIMLTIAYEGTAYRGWQIQPNGLTVQECVERATEKLTGVRHKVLCAGRTDSGVHALGQVASLQTQSPIAAGQFRRGLQRFLPHDISIVKAQEVAADFHATYSASQKTYCYLIFDGPVLPPFLRNLAFHSRKALNVEAMQAAASALMGTHDFRCFETNYPNKSTSIRTVKSVAFERQSVWNQWDAGHDWQPIDPHSHEAPYSPLIRFEITADGFLYNMVRAIVGTLLRVGSGRKPPEFIQEVIESLDRGRAGSTAPPQGLYLVNVQYPTELLSPASDPDVDVSHG